MGILGIGILALAAIAWLGRSVLTVSTTASPIAPSMRVGSTIVTLIEQLEPLVPTLNRSGGSERLTIALLRYDIESGKQRFIKLAEGRSAIEWW